MTGSAGKENPAGLRSQNRLERQRAERGVGKAQKKALCGQESQEGAGGAAGGGGLRVEQKQQVKAGRVRQRPENALCSSWALRALELPLRWLFRMKSE